MRLLPSNGKIVDGTIDYVGYDLAKVTEGQLRGIRWKHISIIFQGAMNALNPVKRIGDQIAEPIVIHDKVDKEAAMKRVGELLELVGIHRRTRAGTPGHARGGCRRVRVARRRASSRLLCPPCRGSRSAPRSGPRSASPDSGRSWRLGR